MSYTQTATETYSVVDIENVMRKFSADLRMIAESSATWSRDQVERYVFDITLMVKEGYISFIDVTLLNGTLEEIRAVRYTTNEHATELTSSRPGGVLWSRVNHGSLRIVIGYTNKWFSNPPDRKQFKIEWIPTQVDLSHASLQISSGRSFVSNSYGIERKDYAK
jgi:hypothetical protein